MAASRQPDEIDAHIGARIRIRRDQVGMSQTTLAEGIGVKFQQVQKYERGVDRISASMLFRVARLLDVDGNYFFEGLEGLPSGSGDAEADRQALAAANAIPEVRRIPELHWETKHGLRLILRALLAEGGGDG